MSEPTRDIHRGAAKRRAPRITSDGSTSAHNLASHSTSPAPPSHSLACIDKPPTGCPVHRPQISMLPDISIVDLSQLVAAVGPELPTTDAVWTETSGLMSSAFAADIPPKIIKDPHKIKTDSLDENVLKQGSTTGTEIRKKSKTKCSPLTGIEVFEIFTQKKHLRGLQFYHLKVSEDSLYRPYNLQVVPCSKAGPDHYIFSPTSVIHVKDGCSVGLISLAEWYHEAILWKALRDIPFFKNYLLHKAFTRWHRNVCYILFQRKCEHLQSQLLISVPQFREALFHLTRLTEKLEKVHWLPQDELHTYTLPDFQSTLLKGNQQSRRSIEKFLQDCSLILTTVEKTCHKTSKNIQEQLAKFQLSQSSKSLYVQQSLSKSLHEKLKQTAQVLQRLDNFKTLMNCMIVQNLVSLTQSELRMYLNKILKREEKNQGSLLQAELTFGVDGQLVLCPSMQLFQELLLQALPSVVNSILQVVDACNNLPEFETSFQQPTTSPELTINASVPLNIECMPNRSALVWTGSLPSKHESYVVLNTHMLPSKLSSSSLQSQSLQEQFYPLSRKQLEWHLHHHSGLQEVEKQQTGIIQEAILEIQQLCERHSWLVEVYLCARKWSPASMESMRGWPAPNYKEHIQMIQSWINDVHHVPDAFTTSNKLFTVICSNIQEVIEPLLKVMEKDVLTVLSDELRLCAQNLTSDLKKSMECLMLEATGLKEFANYFSMVKGCTEIDMHQKLINLCSLQKTIHLHFGDVIPQVSLIEEPFALWNRFVSLLSTATARVMQQLPAMINTLENKFTSLSKQLEDLVCSATTGPYLDLNQNSAELIPELRIKYRQLHIIGEQLNDLSGINQILKGKPLDLSFVMKAKQNMKARKELWELMNMSSAQIQEWRLLLFSQFVASRAQDKLTEWLHQANSVATFIPSTDEVLQETVRLIETFSQQLSLIVKLGNPTIKYKHWTSIFKELGLPGDMGQNLTMGDLMGRELWEHRNEINKICSGAKAEADIEQAFQGLQQSWERTVFRLTKFIPNVGQKKNPQSAETQQTKSTSNVELSQTDSHQNSYGRGTFTIMDLDSLMAQAEDGVMTLSSMLMLPHVSDFKRDIEIWLQLLQELDEILDFSKRYQEKWIFICKMFNDMPMSTKSRELIEKFWPVDQMFRELIQTISNDPYVLNFVRLRKPRETNFDFHGQHLRLILSKGLTAMEEICSQLTYLLDIPRGEFPRLYFLSDEEVIELLSMHLTPSLLLPFVRKCFKGVQWFEVDNTYDNDVTIQNSDQTDTQMWINGVYGTLNEHVPFDRLLKCNLNPVICLDQLEKKLHQTVKQLLLKCIVARQCQEPEEYSPEHEQVDKNIHDGIFIASAKDEEKNRNAITSSFIKLISEYPLQCLLVAEEVQWCSDISNVLLSQAQNKWMHIKAKNTAKLHSLCKAVKEIIRDSYNSNLTAQHTVTALRAIILLIMKHSHQITELVDVKGSPTLSFEWQRLMKYHHSVSIENWSNAGQDNPCNSEDSVYVDVLGKQLVYGNEYIGPENWMMVNSTSTERAHLGIFLALSSFKCAFISGPLMSGKQRTALQLGWALGQQVITLGCCPNTTFPVVSRMLLGALRSGAWLVLSSVDLLKQEVLSVLGQCLTDIQQCLSRIQVNGPLREIQDHSDAFISSSLVGHYVKKDSKNTNKINCQVLSGENFFLAKPNYGCILISSNGYSTEIPENLRMNLRPVSLMQPDSGIIAEVLLISLGFSEATTISRRLISLLSLCKDLCCLPESIRRDHCSWLVLLRKVIDVAGIYLHKKGEETDEEKEADLSFKVNDNVSKDYQLSPHKLSSEAFMSNAVREEQALIKGVMSVLLIAVTDHNKAFQFCTIFEEIFPGAKYCTTFQYIMEESERNALRNAVTEDLQDTPFSADSEILHNVLSLHQALKLSTAVVILGPAGSGKTTTYKALTGALRRLADVCVTDNVADTNSAPSCWCKVDTIVLFPNVLSHEELFGAYCEQGFWRDGAFTKALRNTEQQKCSFYSLPRIKQKELFVEQKVKWLVLDGEPCPKWFDTLGILGNPDNPFLYLSSGRNVHLSQGGIKVLVETTSLKDATPSALGRCSLVCISGNNVWESVWKFEMDALFKEHVLDQNTAKSWKYLAEDLFSSTINFLSYKGLATVMANEGFKASLKSPGVANGLQEVMSFFKILRALLWDSRKRNVSKTAFKQKRDYSVKPFTELHARNLFMIAYIWGFGGQLHPRHWSQFDMFAREALFKCHLNIEVPDTGTVFEQFFDFADKMLEDATCISRFSKNSTPQQSYTSVPQYKNYAYLLDRLLKAHYPALLVGDAGSGKTTLCRNLLQERPHLHVPISPCLRSADLRHILERIRTQNTSMDFSDTISGRQRLVLFVDDLHESAFGKTAGTLETLRQFISRHKVQTSDGYHFKRFSSKAVSYLGTCRTPEAHSSVYSQISPRLSRLFTILILPVMTADILYSIHSSPLEQWLKNFPPMPRLADMAHCIIAATFDLYLTVRKHFSPFAHSPHLFFSLHDLQKVFQGMCLFDPRTIIQSLHQRHLPSSSLLAHDPDFLGLAKNILSIARLWMHECLRTFADRLSSNDDRHKLVSFLLQASENNFCSKLEVESKTVEEMPEPGRQLKSTAVADSQHRHMNMQQDHDGCILTREESSHKVAVSKDKSLLTEPESRSSFVAACLKPHTIPIQPQQLLLDISSSILDSVFSPEFSRLHICRAQKQLNHNIVCQERDLDVLIEQLANIVKSKDAKETYCKRAKFAVHHQRVRQLIHILRALLLPNGHGVLFGAAKKTGRKTTIRLAAYLTGYQLIEVHCGNEVKVKELLKEARRQIDMHGEHVIFMVHENTSEATRDELLLTMESWHHLDEDLNETRPNISAVVKTSTDQRIGQVNKRYLRSKQRHIHVFLLMPLHRYNQERETDESSVITRHIAKALTLCCCVELYHPWSYDALIEIASVHLLDSVDNNALVASMAQAMAAIHQSATKYALAFLETSGVSSKLFSLQTYIELTEYFRLLCAHISDQIETHAKRLGKVLSHLKDLNDAAQDYSREAYRLKVKLQETQKELCRLQMAIDAKHAVCARTHQHCLLKESHLSLLQEQLDLVEQQARDAFEEEAPLYQAALKAMLSLSQSDLDEVRHYRHPPDGVVMLMNAVCKLFNCPCNWESCRQLLWQPRFLQELQFFDHSKLDNGLFEELGQIVQSPNFQTDLVCGVSQACESLCSWVRAVYQYACVKRSMAPHEAHKDHLNQCMAEIREQLHVARLQEEAAQEELEVVRRQHHFIENYLKELSAQLHRTESQEKEAAATIEQLSSFAEKWNMAKKETEMNEHTLPGDALIIAATITYLGPFGPGIRLELLKKWHKMCLTGKIKISPRDVRLSLFDEPPLSLDKKSPFVKIPVATELHKALSHAFRDSQLSSQAVSPDPVLKLLLWAHRAPWAHKWALLTDTQHHKQHRSYKMLIEYSDGCVKDKEFELIVSADDPEFIQKVSHGAEKGLKVLVTEIEVAAPKEDFLSMLDRPNSNHLFGLFNPVTKLHPEFCLFLSTSLPAKVLLEEIHPLILEKVKVIDLSLSTSEVQGIILSDLTQYECSELWLKHCQLQQDKQMIQNKLHVEEVYLVDYIVQSSIPLLHDPGFLSYVRMCRITSLGLQEEIEKVSNEMDRHQTTLNDFHCISVLATALYRALRDVGDLYPFYFFPLCKFLIALRDILSQKGLLDVSCSAETENTAVMSDTLHRIVSHLFAYYQHFLFQSHAELLRLFFSVALFMHAGECSELELAIFLRGFSNIAMAEHDSSPEQCGPVLPSWIPTHAKPVLGFLEKIPPFHGLMTSLRDSSKQWQEYFHFPSATVIGPAPCQSYSQLTTLQCAILWKTFCPQWLAAVVDDLFACQLGHNIQSAVGDSLQTSSSESISIFLSKNKGPILVTVPNQLKTGSGYVHPLFWIKYCALDEGTTEEVKVVVISFGSKCQTDCLLSSLNTAVESGHWLVLNNCHLLDRWDSRVITRLRQCLKKEHWSNMDAGLELNPNGESAENQPHPQFRLWFITKANAPISIPAFIRMCATHLVFDSHWDLKDELCTSFRHVTTVIPATNTVDPIHRAAILHSVLMQRQKVEHLGHGKISFWSYEDLLALTEAYVYMAKVCHDPVRALEYVAAYLIYGGHVSDSADLEAVGAVCRACLQPPPSLRGSGPHILSEMISMKGHFDDDILKDVQNCIETTLNNNDTLLIGFSAAMKNDIVKIRSHTLRKLLLQCESSVAAVRHDSMSKNLAELTDYKVAQERLQILQTRFEQTKGRSVGERKISLGPIRAFLQTEWENLAETISSFLVKDFPSSPNITSSIISELETRANLLQMYQMEECSSSCRVYCLSAFANPRGILAALIRETVHTKHSDINQVTLHYQVLGATAFKPSDGICLYGLKLHGASWDSQLGVLQTTLSPEPCAFPLVWVRAQVRNVSCLSSSASSTAHPMPLYNCPLYLDSQCKDGDWDLSMDNIITNVPLRTRLEPVLCKMRRVRLVSALQENKCR